MGRGSLHFHMVFMVLMVLMVFIVFLVFLVFMVFMVFIDFLSTSWTKTRATHAATWLGLRDLNIPLAAVFYLQIGAASYFGIGVATVSTPCLILVVAMNLLLQLQWRWFNNIRYSSRVMWGQAVDIWILGGGAPDSNPVLWNLALLSWPNCLNSAAESGMGLIVAMSTRIISVIPIRPLTRCLSCYHFSH